jgi:hypothetical protein
MPRYAGCGCLSGCSYKQSLNGLSTQFCHSPNGHLVAEHPLLQQAGVRVPVLLFDVMASEWDKGVGRQNSAFFA